MSSSAMGEVSRTGALDNAPILFTDSSGASLNPDVAAALAPAHLRMVETLLVAANAGKPIPAPCFNGDVSPLAIKVLDAVFSYGQQKFFGTDDFRWDATVTNGSGLVQGDPTTLTFSFVPDGTTLLDSSSGAGEPNTPSNLNSVMDAGFGSSVWKDKIREVLAAWSDVTGITYVEVADDGAAFPTSMGLAGVRGDIRIGGHSIDGSGAGTLAYNYFPEFGDMVIDTDNVSFFTDSANGFRKFKNTVSHEHGHGLGMFHVCPNNGVIVMEPIVPVGAGAPDLFSSDDIASIQRKYGDSNEKVGSGNNTSGAATSLGALPIDEFSPINGLSIDAIGDLDFYSFTISDARLLSVTLSPTGGSFSEAAQIESDALCTGVSPSAFNLDTKLNLGVEVIDSNGTTVLATANSSPAGSDETVSDVLLAAPGTYFLRVFTNDADTTGSNPDFDDQVQLYDMTLFSTAAEVPDPVEPPAEAPLGSWATILIAFLVSGAALAAVSRLRKV